MEIAVKDSLLLRAIGFAAASLIGSSVLAEEHPAHWGYEGHGAPSHWGDMQQDFANCKLGQEQSPIDIQTKSVKKAALPSIRPSYRASSAELVNNGHTIQVNLADGGKAELSNGAYKILQFHFHTPSEEKINGKNFPLVAHLVHRNDAGNLAVIAVLFRQGKENAALKPVFDHLLAKEGKAPLAETFDAGTLMPPNLGYYAFKGSLTTPPCSEGVSWHVLRQPLEMSAQQIAAFKKIFKANARPVQPLNGREVVEVD